MGSAQQLTEDIWVKVNENRLKGSGDMERTRDSTQRESNFDFVFLVDEGGEGPNTIISGPSSAHQRKPHFNGVTLACR